MTIRLCDICKKETSLKDIVKTITIDGLLENKKHLQTHFIELCGDCRKKLKKLLKDNKYL